MGSVLGTSRSLARESKNVTFQKVSVLPRSSGMKGQRRTNNHELVNASADKGEIGDG